MRVFEKNHHTDIVPDIYNKGSLKSATRDGRGTGKVRRVKPSTEIPGISRVYLWKWPGTCSLSHFPRYESRHTHKNAFFNKSKCRTIDINSGLTIDTHTFLGKKASVLFDFCL